VTGAVGLLLGSVAWALTGQFAAAPLVFIASLATAIALAIESRNREAFRNGRYAALEQELRAAHSRLASMPTRVDHPVSAAEQPSGRRRDLELNDVLDAALEALAGPVAARRLVVERTPPDTYLAVHADPEALSDCLEALLAEAFDACPAGGALRIDALLADDRATVRTTYTAEVDGVATTLVALAAAGAPVDRSTGRLMEPSADGVAMPSRSLPGAEVEFRQRGDDSAEVRFSLPFGHAANRLPAGSPGRPPNAVPPPRTGATRKPLLAA
ncbi:MAG: hypothetical protein AAF907_09290, partial [Planctomycetota bacterium]